MKLPKILRLCVYALSALAGLFVFIPCIAGVGTTFQLLFSQSFLVGLVFLVMLAFATLWLVFAVLGLILFLVKGEEAGKKSAGFGLWCDRGSPLVLFVVSVLLNVLYALMSGGSGEAIANYLASIFANVMTWVVLVLAILPLLFWKIGNKNGNKVTAAVLKGIAAVLVLVVGILLQPGALTLVGLILAFLALGVETALPFVKE